MGLERYVPAFRETEIDEQVLPRLTAEDLKDLGVTVVGHRRRLLDGIAALQAAGQVAALEHGGDRLPLDRGWVFVALFTHSAQDRLGQPEV